MLVSPTTRTLKTLDPASRTASSSTTCGSGIATSDGYALDSVSLRVNACEVVALVGPSGAGKTTFANLVPRFQDVTSGVIRIDGKDVRDTSARLLRSQIGIVSQDTFLFNATVAENIRYGRPRRHAESRVEEAARNAMAEEFICELAAGIRYGHR